METNEIYIPISIGELYIRVSRALSAEEDCESDLELLNAFRNIIKEEKKEKEARLFKKTLSISSRILKQEAAMQEFLDRMNDDEGRIDHREVNNNHELGMAMFEIRKELKAVQAEINILYGSTTQ